MATGGNRRTTQYIYSIGTDEPINIFWRIGFGNGLTPSAITNTSQVQGTLNSSFTFTVVPSYSYSPTSSTLFITNQTWVTNFVPTYVALFTETVGGDVNSLLALRSYTTPLVSGQNKTVIFSFSGFAL